MRRILLSLLLLTVIAGGYFGYRLIWGKPLNIHHFADRVMLERLVKQPELITFLGFIENTPLDFHSDRLTDYSPDSLATWHADAQANYERLQSYREDSLNQQEQLTLEFMEWTLGSGLAAAEQPYQFDNVFYVGPYPVNQISGAQLEPLNTLNDLHQIVDLDSSKRYLQRMAAIPGYMQSLIDAVQYRDTLEANPPQIVIARSLQQINDLVDVAANDWSIHKTLVNALEELDMEESERQAMASESLKIVQKHVIPAYQELADALNQILPRAPAAVGVWTLPNGDDYYQALLYAQASTRMPPDEIHDLGLKLVAGFRDEILVELVGIGYAEGSIAERIDQMMNEPSARYVNSDAGRQQVIDDFTRIGVELEEETASVFGMRSAAGVVVERVPEYAEDGEALARYSPPSQDGSRPGRFMINLRAPDEIKRQGMRTLSAHEAIPGHHFEITIRQSLSGLPMIRRNAYIASYSEGWALYAEHLVHELGLHDARSNIGRLQSMLFRAARLVVDTGIHKKRWTREEAITYMRENTGMPLAEVTTEVERYIAMPGQACSYMLGMQAILESRKAAQARLGDAFNLPDFHDAVLANGALPIEALQGELDLMLR
ncbi:MAG: DUF885 domain-containing protein [Halioglobus sp.]